MQSNHPSDQHLPTFDQKPYRWTMLTLVWLLYLSHGVVSRSASPLVTPILKDLEMSYGQMGFVLGSWQLTYLVVAMLAGFALDRWGVRKSLFFGAVIVSLSEMLRFFAQGLTVFISPELDLITVADAFAKDQQAQVEQWMRQQQVHLVSDQQAQQWINNDMQVWAVVVKPWILVQTIS